MFFLRRSLPLNIFKRVAFFARFSTVGSVSDGRKNEHYTFPKEFDASRRPSHDRDANRNFNYLLVGLTGALFAIGIKDIIINALGILAPSSEALALGQIEVDISNIPVGKSAIVKWRGKPIFIKHRTKEEITEAQSVDVSELRDPQTDQERVQKPEWLIALGVCTHLGCVPTADSGDYGGWYCPCQYTTNL